MDEAQKPSSLQENLRQLTDEIGGRVPGTPAMAKGIAWGVEKFKAAGADSVHVEKYTISHSWAEGDTRLTVVSPGPFQVRAVSSGWGAALAPTKNAGVVDVGTGKPEDFAKAGNFSGKLLLVHTDVLQTWEDLFNEYLNAPPILAAAIKGHALAVAFMATREHDLLYRHTNAPPGELDKIPQLVIAREDGERMARLLAAGKTVTADLQIPNKIGGAFEESNVVAEIRGSEKPDEFVVLGAHLDSWELGTGALDNGCNSALVVDALRAIHNSGVRPKRSIRFILFTGEEEGLLGSWEYVKAHRKEMEKAIAAVIFDSGTGHVTGFTLGGRKDLVAVAQSLVAPFHALGADTLTNNADAGTDNVDFLLEGVPTFVANQDEANYLINYHAESDTFDKVDFPNLKQHAVEAAVLSFELADRAERLGPRLHRAEIEQSLRETGLDNEMRMFGIWPYWERKERGRVD